MKSDIVAPVSLGRGASPGVRVVDWQAASAMRARVSQP
jgi:hypothetical protein